jgi:hypothetical protein
MSLFSGRRRLGFGECAPFGGRDGVERAEGEFIAVDHRREEDRDEADDG